MPLDNKECCRRYYQTHKEEHNKRCAIWKKKNKQKCSQYSKTYRKKHPERSGKVAARFRAREPLKHWCRWHAQKYYPMGAKCEVCGGTTLLQRHHENYLKPEVFQTVCQECHTKITLLQLTGEHHDANGNQRVAGCQTIKTGLDDESQTQEAVNQK